MKTLPILAATIAKLARYTVSLYPILFCNHAIYASILFQDITSSAGFVYRGPTYSISWGDLNADIFPDLWTGNHFAPPILYKNQGNGVFSDVTELVAGLDQLEIVDYHGSAWADYDNDGDQDLLELWAGRGPTTDGNRLLVNNDGILAKETAAHGLRDPLAVHRMPLWMDYNRDGQLDLFMNNNGAFEPEGPSKMFMQMLGRFDDTSLEVGFNQNAGKGDDTETAQLSDVTGDGYLDLIISGPRNTSYPRLVYDIGSIPFTDITSVSDLLQTSPARDFAYTDVNGDLLPDVIILPGTPGISDVVQPSTNTLKATFTVVVGREHGISFKSSSAIQFQLAGRGKTSKLEQIFIGASGLNPEALNFQLSTTDPQVLGLADHIPGTDAGIYIGYNSDLDAWSIQVSSASGDIAYVKVLATAAAPITDVTTVGFVPRRPNRSPRVLLSSASGLVDRTQESGLDTPADCGNVGHGDFDNDGDIDLYFVCSGEISNYPNILYENVGDGAFIPVPGAGGAEGSSDGVGGAVGVADFDVDGFLDLFVSNGRGLFMNDEGQQYIFHDGPHQLFHNAGNENHWLEMDLIGIESNRDGIGARVTLTANEKTQLREQNGGMHWQVQNHQRIHFGLAQSEKADSIRIHWPSGIEQELTDVPADQLLQVREPTTPGFIGAPSYTPGTSSGVYLWKDSIDDGPYILRVVGGPAVSNFTVTVLSTEALSSTQPVALESDDELDRFSYGFQLRSKVLNDQDGLDFNLPAGSKAMISITEDGKPHPRHLGIGPTATSIPPAGWIVDTASLGFRPDSQPGEMGLVIGNRSGTGNMTEFRWRTDGRLHDVELDLLAGEPLLTFQPVGLSGNDVVASGENWVKVTGRLDVGQDGIDIDRGVNSIIGIAFQMDSLLPAHRVSSGAGNLGLPNAYWLPDVVAPDNDSDGIDNAVDNCVFVPNPMQEDMDSDGIGDGCDNCRHVANTDQRDSDSDGYGSLCDADFNNDGIVNFTDSAYLNSVFSTADPLADLNGDGIVDSADHSIMISLFFKHPGPVGFASIAFDNVNSTAGITRNDNTFGVSWGDLNSDGLPDALLSNHFKTPSLYLNQGDGSFLEVAAAHELTMNPEDPHGAAWADYDNDGDQDAVMVSGGPGWSTAFLINESGTLKIHDPNVTGLSYGWSDRTPTWLDENNDGLLDITIVSTSSKHPQFKSVMFNQNSDHTFEIKHDFGVGGAWASLLTGPLLSAVPEILFSSGNSFTRESGAWVNNTAQVFPPGTQSTIGTDYAYGDVNGDGILDLYVFRQGNRAQLTTEGNLVQATYRAVANNLSGFDFITDGTSLTINFGLSIAPNQFRLGAGQVPATVIGEFNSVIVNSTSPEVLGEPTITLGTQAVWVWYNPDLKQWHVRFGNASSNRNVEFHIESDQPVTNLSGVNFPVDSLQRNYLYLGNGAGGFLPDDLQSGLSFTGPTRAGAFGDFDNDMDLDLYLVNRNAATNAPNQLFTNDGAGNFTEVIGAGNAEGSTSGSGESVSTADYDQDGFLDLFVTNGRSDLRNPYPGPHELFHNTGNGNHWLEIDLIGVQSTRDAIGAFVELEAGGKKQVRFQDGGIHAFGQHHQRVHFGLAQSEKADLIRIHWPSGIVQELTDIPADQLLQVHEPSAPGLIGAPSYTPGTVSGVYLWKDSIDGPYLLRVVGGPAMSNFNVTVLSTEALSATQPVSLESDDELDIFTYGFQLRSNVLNDLDGLDFDLPAGSNVMISIIEDGKPHPRHLRIGPTATSIPPAGWIVDTANLGLRPDSTPGEMGLVVGNRSSTGNISEFRWRADGRLHDVELDLMAGEPLLTFQPVGLSGNDVVASGDNWVKVSSLLDVGQEGIDIDRGINSIIGIAFQMDSLLPAHRVSSGAGTLGLPNAYWLAQNGDFSSNIGNIADGDGIPDADTSGSALDTNDPDADDSTLGLAPNNPDGDSGVEPLASTSSGGGGCALNTAAQEDPDPIFPLLMLTVLGYWFRRHWLLRQVCVRTE